MTLLLRYSGPSAIFLLLAMGFGASAWAQSAGDEAYTWPWGRFVSAILMILLFGAVALTWLKQVKTTGQARPGFGLLKRVGDVGANADEPITLDARRMAPSGVVLQSVSWKGRSYLLAIQRDKLTVIDQMETAETSS